MHLGSRPIGAKPARPQARTNPVDDPSESKPSSRPYREDLQAARRALQGGRSAGATSGKRGRTSAAPCAPCSWPPEVVKVAAESSRRELSNGVCAAGARRTSEEFGEEKRQRCDGPGTQMCTTAV